MNDRGKAVLASLGIDTKGNVQVMPPETKAGGARYGFMAKNPAYAPLAEELTLWANGDLSFLATGTPVKPDKGKRRRDAMADVLDGKKS